MISAPNGTQASCGPTAESYHIARHVGERRPYGIRFALRRVALYVRTGFRGSRRLLGTRRPAREVWPCKANKRGTHMKCGPTFQHEIIRFSHEEREGHEEDRIHGCLWPDWRFSTVAGRGANRPRRTPVTHWRR